jgi:hypothetical protein
VEVKINASCISGLSGGPNIQNLKRNLKRNVKRNFEKSVNLVPYTPLPHLEVVCTLD